MRVPRLVSLGVVMLLSLLVLPMGTAAQGNSAAAHTCQGEGYLNYTDAAGEPFKNAGRCVRYVVQGGTLQPAAYIRVIIQSVPTPKLVDAWIEGAGLAPGTQLELEFQGVFYPLHGTVDMNGNYRSYFSSGSILCETEHRLRATAASGGYVYGVFRFPCPFSNSVV